MTKIIGIGNALLDIIVPIGSDEVLRKAGLPKGSMQLIDNESVGLIVKSNSVLSVKKALIYCVENLEVIRCNSKKNIKYFEQNRAKNMAKYFVDCITK